MQQAPGEFSASTLASWQLFTTLSKGQVNGRLLPILLLTL